MHDPHGAADLAGFLVLTHGQIGSPGGVETKRSSFVSLSFFLRLFVFQAENKISAVPENIQTTCVGENEVRDTLSAVQLTTIFYIYMLR